MMECWIWGLGRQVSWDEICDIWYGGLTGYAFDDVMSD